jgi:hypothetical protein
MTTQKYNGWVQVKTIQSKEILSELIDAKEHQLAKLLINATGNGKSYVTEMFKQAKPTHTYVITVGYSYKLVHVIDSILVALGIQRSWAKNMINEKLALITERLLEIIGKGGKPIIILDEAENLQPAVLKAIKELYDAIHLYCAIVLIGTDQILDQILNRRNKNRQSVPQLWRRFRAGTRNITPIDKVRDFRAFFQLYIPDQPNIQDLLIEKCDNYGELHDFLDPFLRYASDSNKPVTEELFLFFHKIKAA